MANPFDEFDKPSNPFDEFDEDKTSFGEDVDIGIAGLKNLVDTTGSLAAHTLSRITNNGGDESILEELDKRRKQRVQESNPKQKKQGIGGALTSGLVQIPGMVFGPAPVGINTAVDFIERGETLEKAALAGGVDAALQTLGIALPLVGKTAAQKIVGNALINPAQGALSDAAVAAIADNPETKAAYDWANPERRVADAVMGGGLGAIASIRKPQVIDDPNNRLNNIKPKDIANTKAADLLTNEARQFELFDQPEMGRVANPYEAKLGDWRVDENGIPIKADLSMEVQNMYAPLQRNLWGDELEPVRNPVGQNADLFAENGQQQGRPLTEAIDQMPDLPWRGDRDVGLDMLKGNVEPDVQARGLLEGAQLEAETTAPVKQMRRGRGPSRGVIDPDLLTFGVTRLIDYAKNKGLDNVPGRVLSKFKGTFDLNELKTWADESRDPMSRTRLVWMTPEEFLKIAEERPNPDNAIGVEKRRNIKTGLDTETGLRDVPALFVSADNKVWGHEGRHRMDVFIEKGLDKIPVRLETSVMRNNDLDTNQLITGQNGTVHKFPEPVFQKDKPNTLSTGRGPARGGISPELLTFGLSNLFNKKQPKFLDDILNTKLYAEAVSGDDVVKAALAEGPEKPSNVLTRATTNMGAGGTMEAAKRNSVAILGSSRIIQRAKNIAEDKVRSTVFPVENSLRQAKKSIEHLASFLKREQVGKELLGEKALADEGADLKAVAAYNQLRNMQKTIGDYINSTLSSLGKRNIELDPAYMTSIWKGDFKTIFYREIANADGSVKNKPVAVISADTKLGLKKQLEAFKKQNPDLANLKTEDASVKGPGRQGSDFTHIFNTMLEVLGENDPAMQKVAAWAEMNTEMQGKKMLGETKHFIPKTGVMGYVGDRPSNTIFGGFNNKKEALAYLQAQVDVAKAAYQWGEMQKAAIEMKKILNNEELAAQQPHNIRFIRDYWLDNLGMTDSAVARAIDDTVLRKWLGVSPGAISNTINHIKSFWISQKILGAPYYIANAIQYLNVIPHLTDMSVKWGGNPVYAISAGMMDGLLTASGHMAHTLKGSDDIKPNLYRIAAQGGMSEFSIRAMKYAEDNSVTTRSIYDEAPIESSIGVLGPAKRVTTGLISAPETFLRSFAYMTYAHMLKSSGKFTNDMDVFRMAEERVNRSMGDYRTGERALMFGKMGTVGTAANTLTTFPMNYFNNWSWAAREAGRGNVLPFVAMFATQFLAAGAMGIPGFADMDKIWEWIKDSHKDNPKTWDKIKDIDLQEVARSFGGDLGLYGLPSVLTDTALTSRAAAPLGTEMVQTPGAPFADLARQGSSVLNAAMDPTNPQKAGQALYNISPPLAQGLFETTVLKDLISTPNEDGTRTYTNPRNMSDREGMVDRGPREEKLRKFGLRSLNEQKELDLVYKAKKKNTDSREVGQNAIKEAYNAARLGNKEKAREYINLYVKLTGSQNPDIEALVKKEFMTRAERAPETLTTPAGMRAVKIMNEILQEGKE